MYCSERKNKNSGTKSSGQVGQAHIIYYIPHGYSRLLCLREICWGSEVFGILYIYRNMYKIMFLTIPMKIKHQESVFLLAGPSLLHLAFGSKLSSLCYGYSCGACSDHS